MRNWAGTYTYAASELHEPATLDELRALVASAPRIRALGSRHSFSDIADSAVLVSVDGLPADIVIDERSSTVSFGAGVRYGELASVLRAHDLALHNLASLPHISVAGAIATATHGSGDRQGNLATAVAAVTLVTSGGELVEVARGDADFEGMVVNLGALGVMTRLTLDVEPAYEVRQTVYERLPWEALREHLDDIMAAGDSVSVFTQLSGVADQVWVKERVRSAQPVARTELFGAAPAAGERHPVPGMDPRATTAQLGVAGLWADRLAHFRMDFMPSSGAELQSEYLVGRRDAVAALDALRSVAADVRPVLQVCELRTIAADALWLSPQHGRDTLGMHFTWAPDQAAAERAVARIEEALAPLGARPHWGKLFLMASAAVAARYERLEDFRRLAAELDPRGAFRNAWLERHVLGDR
jgi:xylitol oxidase